MSRLSTYYIFVLSVLLLLNACSSNVERPNVIFVLTDDQGWGDIGYNNNEIIYTPNLDELSTKSVVLDRFYVSPVCAPTRASILTGKYHLSTGVSWVTRRMEVMNESETTIGEIYKQNEYHTAYFGKWHNGAQYPHNPNGQGFDTFFGFCAGHTNSYFDAQLQWNNKLVQTKGYIADLLTDSLINYIQKQEEPYFAFLAYNTPHTPYQVPDKYFDKYIKEGLDTKTASIYGMVENIDHNLGRVLSTLQKNKQLDNTIFVFTSDNGPNYVRYNGGLKGRKAQVDEGGVRVPFLIHYPNGKFKNRRISKGFASHIDMLPTLCELCGINYEGKIDGESFVESLQKEKELSTSKTFYTHQMINEHGDFKGAVRTHEYLLTANPDDTALYNLLQDPCQIQNIYPKNKALSDSLSDLYENWLNNLSGSYSYPEAIHLGSKYQGYVDFPAHEAKLSEGLQYAGKNGWANDWITCWDSENDSISWKIEVESDCICEAILLYACKKEDVGKEMLLKTEDNIYSMTIVEANEGKTMANYDRVTRAEVPERAWGEIFLPSVQISESNKLLSICYAGDNASSIEIKGLTLTIN